MSGGDDLQSISQKYKQTKPKMPNKLVIKKEKPQEKKKKLFSKTFTQESVLHKTHTIEEVYQESTFPSVFKNRQLIWMCEIANS